MLENTPNTGYSDADNSILLKEGVGKALLASAEKERAMSIDIQQLRKEVSELKAENDQLKREKEEKDRTIADLRRQLAEATKQTITNNITINNAENLAMGDYVQAEIARGVVRDLYKQM